MRAYLAESIESKCRAELEQLGEYSIVIPLHREDIGKHIVGFDKMDTAKSNELCREVVNILELEMITLSNKKNEAGTNKFMSLVKDAIEKVCRMNGLKYQEEEEVYLLGLGDA
jgi:hypothetical protein